MTSFAQFFSRSRSSPEPIEHGPFDDVVLLGSRVADESPRIIKMIRANANKGVSRHEIARALWWKLRRLDRVARNARPRIVFRCEARVVPALDFEREAEPRGA